MKKIKLIGLSTFITMLLIVSSLSTGAIKINLSKNENNFSMNPTNLGYGEIIVKKEVYFEDTWIEGPIYANIGDNLQFRINITYQNNSEDAHHAHNIRVNDSFPPCLNYSINTADPVEDEWSNDPDEYLFWDFDDSIILNDMESFTIYYNATVVNTTSVNGEENIATVIFDEQCTGGYNIESSDSLLIGVESTPVINVLKEVWDPVNLKFIKATTAYSDETLQFRINVSNDGFVDLTSVELKDELPPFLDYISASEIPTVIDDKNISWNLGTLPAGNWIKILLDVSVQEVSAVKSGKNYANVTSDGDYNDSDFVDITVKQHLIVDKKVRNPDTGEWVEELPYVKGCEPVRFRINITYFGDLRTKCLVVYDQFSIEPFRCLEYAGNLYVEIDGVEIPPTHEDFYPDIYFENDTFVWCEESIKVPLGGIYFSWINKSIGGGMVNGDNVIIEFDANVIDYCEGIYDDGCGCGHGYENCQQTNCVDAWLWGCCCDIQYWERDCVTINCTAPPIEVNKTVWDPDLQDWVDELETVEGYTIRFKIEFTYYGNGNLTNVSIKDVLPCCLEYADNSNYQASWVSSDKKVIWWNITQNISDCETFTLEFDAFVSAASECGGCINFAHVWGKKWLYCETYEDVFYAVDTATITAIANSPPGRPDISGPIEGIVGVQLSFKIFLEDPDGNQVYYKINWGDQTTSWLGPTNPGEITVQHVWSSAGSYNIIAQAKDIHEAVGDWTQYPHTVQIKTAEVSIEISLFHINSVKATVENTGTGDLTDLSWEFNISRNSTINFRDINIDGSGIIASLPAGQIATIQSDSVGLKFGMADLTLTVEKTGVVDKTATGQVFLLGPLVFVFDVTVS